MKLTVISQLMFLFVCLGATKNAYAMKTAGSYIKDDTTFPTPHAIRNQVRFWEKVFGKYPSTTIVIHDALDPGRIVDLIDYTTYGLNDGKPMGRGEREENSEKFVERYQQAVTRFQRYGRKALKFGAIEKRVFKAFNRHPSWLKRLYSGEVEFRAQRGLADDFIAATATANAYLPYMERVFKRYNVPTRLTRLAFVESMFNAKAMSKVGASGVWQFMPATARNFIRVDKLIDERNSIYKATRAAARLLAQNYQILESWPLAITAYNHGPQGMRRAMKQLGTSDIGQIVTRYRSNTFGFASRNFYAEFIAAANVYDKISRAGLAREPIELPDLRSIYLEKPLSIESLVNLTPLTEADIRRYNPCLRGAAFKQYRKARLPEKYELFVPASLANAVTVAIRTTPYRYARR